MQLSFNAITEAQPGPQWQALFKHYWPAYRAWFLARGGAARPALEIAVKNLRRHMPELEPTYDRLVELAGGDETAARFLSCYRPPPYLISCSQAVLRSPDGPLLLRNYDLDPTLNEGLILQTAWNGRQVMASSEFIWGVADGMNDAGLALSLAFGGRKAVGNGFGIPLILRYILEFCDRTKEAVEVLQRVPSHMAYNITVIDRDAKWATVQVGPHRPVSVTQAPQATNHQGKPEWNDHSRFTHTLERERVLRQHLTGTPPSPKNLLTAFLRPPLYSSNYQQGFGTLYTALYRPAQGQAEWHWPDTVWRQAFGQFQPSRKTVQYSQTGAKVLAPEATTTTTAAATTTTTTGKLVDWDHWAQAGDFSLASLIRQTRQSLPTQQRPFLGHLLNQLSSELPKP
jgi:predicted choloylglycine hydrolase